MKSTKLYKTLKSFDIYQLNRLKKFVDSPYFNPSEKLQKLFSTFYEHIKNEGKAYSREQLWKQLYPTEKFSDVKLRKKLSDLLKLVEDFLSVEAFDKDPIQKAYFLLQSVKEQRLEVLYNNAIKTSRRLSRRQPDRSANFFFNQYLIEKSYYELTQAEIHRSERSNIDRIIKNLDFFYLAEKLKYYCTLLSRRKIQQHDYEILFIEEILEHIRNEDYGDHPQILVYYHVYKLHDSSNNKQNYYILKDLIREHHDLFSEDDLRDIYLAAINFCIANLNKGDKSIIIELYEIYRQALDANALLINGELSPWSYKNIVITGLRAGQDDWVEQFINEYAAFLNSEYRENALKFNLARLHHYRKEYDQVIPLLNEVEFTDFSYNLGAKALLLATYYELGEEEALHSFLDSFQVYLNRNKKSLPENRRQNYLNLVKYIRRLVNLLPGDKEGITKLEKEIDEQAKIADRAWLKKKIAELKSPKPA